MGLVIVTVNGAAQFDGLTATTGLVVLPDEDRQPGPSRAIIHSLSLRGQAGGGLVTADLFFRQPLPWPAIQFREQHPKSWQGSPIAPLPLDLYLGCGLVVPPSFTELRFITTGKTATATLIIDWSPVQPGSGCLDTVAGLSGGAPPPA